MLSNKMTVSLMSLITILALAFSVPSVMAGNFATTITVGGHDVSHEAGEQRTVGDITLNVTFGQVVALDSDAGTAAVVVPTTAVTPNEDFDVTDFIVRAYDANGAVVDDGTVITAAITPGSPANGMNFVVALAAIPATTRTLYVQIPEGAVGAADPTVVDDDDANEKKDVTVKFLIADPSTGATEIPTVLKIAMVGEPFTVVTSETFMVHVLLSEDAKAEDPSVGGLTVDLIDVGDNATVDSVVKLASPAGTMTVEQIGGLVAADGTAVAGTTVLNTLDTWRDEMLHLYLFTIGTKPGEKTVTIKVKDFAGMENPAPGTAQEMYIRRADADLAERRDKLTVKTMRDDPKDALTGGSGFFLDHAEGTMIPAGGFLLIAKDLDGSGIAYSDKKDKENKEDQQTPAQLMFNTRAGALPNLENLLTNGGTIYLVTTDAVSEDNETGIEPGSVVISEIMWGSDAALADSTTSQWIEIHNTTDEDIPVGEKKWALFFFAANEILPAADTEFVIGADAAGTAVDSVGTRDVSTGTFWSIAGKGQSGVSDVNPTVEAAAPIIGATVPIISMQRVSDADGVYAGGMMSASWIQSERPALNFKTGEGTWIGTPGAEPAILPEVEIEEEEPDVPVAMPEDIMITEIMVDTGDGRLPQWIELTNVSGAEVSLAGWSVTIENSAADADAVGESVSINLSGTIGVGEGEGNGDGMGMTLLLVAWDGRNSRNLEGNERVVDVSDAVGETGRYKLISDMAFMIALIPPQETGILEYGDTAGNLGAAEAWDIPMADGARSSLIRREMLADGMATMGTAANGWVLASDTPLVSGPATWYGSDEDAGTPGYDAGGPLPVELSHFRPARNKQTGAVVITWSTQSELNNAGFFIKRSQQRDGQFVVVNPTMIPGAGTTSEKQFYTYTDTTAQPNVVYYYQIEDVSLDGNRQTLTNGIRLKGHIGAAGKLTTTWGDLKTSNE